MDRTPQGVDPHDDISGHKGQMCLQPGCPANGVQSNRQLALCSQSLGLSPEVHQAVLCWNTCSEMRALLDTMQPEPHTDAGL